MPDNVETARRFYREVMGQGDVALIDELTTEDFVEHEEFPGIPPGREGVKQWVGMFRAGFPDLRVQVDEILEAGDRVIARIHFRGTHRGEFMGMAPTGREIDVQCIDIVRVDGGRAAEHWGVTDVMAMMQQLGAVPEGATA